MQNKTGMISDKLENAEKYYSMHPAFARAFEYLRTPGLDTLSVGRHDIDGDKMYCLVDDRQGRTKEEAVLEAHRQYIDIQYVISGPETFGLKPTASCTDIKTPYKPDIIFYNDVPETWQTLPSGSFAIFMPEDAHAPLVSDGQVHKAVIKVLIDQ